MDDYDIIKELGTGSWGTVYLVEKDNVKYALKIQKITSKTVNYNDEAWRELDTYGYINQLPRHKQMFFTRLYDYTIVDNCDYKNTFKSKSDHMDQINASTTCLKILMEYKNSETLLQYMTRRDLTKSQMTSILLQIANIILILGKGEYAHGDISPNNLIVCETNEEYFTMGNKNVPFHGLHVTIIDYGFVKHRKYNIQLDKFERWFLNKEKFMFIELLFFIVSLLSFELVMNERCTSEYNYKNYRVETKYEMITKYNNVYNTIKNKYIDIFPKMRSVFNNYVGKNIKQKIVQSYSREHTLIWKLIKCDLQYSHPKIFKSVYRPCVDIISPYSRDELLSLLQLRDFKSIVKALYSML